LPENKDTLLEKLNTYRKTRHTLRQIICSLSLLVVFAVFWSLKLTGIGVAGEAFCGIEEHTHTEECTLCNIIEHVHTEECYSDITADIETSDEWEMSLSGLVKGPTIRENTVIVAKSQLGYKESTLNFQEVWRNYFFTMDLTPLNQCIIPVVPIWKR